MFISVPSLFLSQTGKLHSYFLHVLNVVCLLANNNRKQIKAAVMYGNRPVLDDITAPANLLPSLKTWIGRCWDATPDERPSFDSQ